MIAYRAGGLWVRCCQGGDDGAVDVVGFEVGFADGGVVEVTIVAFEGGGFLVIHDCLLTVLWCAVVNV